MQRSPSYHHAKSAVRSVNITSVGNDFSVIVIQYRQNLLFNFELHVIARLAKDVHCTFYYSTNGLLEDSAADENTSHNNDCRKNRNRLHPTCE